MKHVFDILEKSLRAEEPAVIFLTSRYTKPFVRFITLQLVLRRRPANMAHPPDLLDRQQGGESNLSKAASMVQPPQNTTRWDAAKLGFDSIPPRMPGTWTAHPSMGCSCTRLLQGPKLSRASSIFPVLGTSHEARYPNFSRVRGKQNCIPPNLRYDSSPGPSLALHQSPTTTCPTS